MQVKRYEAASIREAIQQIKKDLGPDAVVLATKQLQGKKKLVEVLAARDIQVESGPPKNDLDLVTEVPSGKPEMLNYFRTELDELKSLILNDRRDYYQDIAELKETMNIFFDVMGLSDRTTHNNILSRLYYYLLSRGLSQQRSCKLIEQLKITWPAPQAEDYEKCLIHIESLLTESFVCNADKSSKRIKVFLGPTGVGKTTTLAKLAARYALEQKISVGIISMDTFRIAAPEQLRIYSRIMGLPLEIASEKNSFKKSLDFFSDRDVILVDTPGRSLHDSEYLNKLNDIFTVEEELEKNLLLNPSSSRGNLRDVLLRFKQFDCENIILSKMDECRSYGIISDVNEQARKPVVYFTTGQNVPQDIEQANPAKLAQLIMRH